MIKIVPSILSNDPDEVRQLIERCESVVDRVSIDIIDGKFAGNKTIDPSCLSEIDTNLKIDFQLMVVEPVNWVEKCVSAGADRIIGHIEHMTSQRDFVSKVTAAGVDVGLALDLPTPVSAIDSSLANDLDLVLVMSVPAGFGGQKFDPEVIEKFIQLDKVRVKDNTPFVIHDDGGVTFDYIDDLRLEGVDEVSIGRKLFEGDLKANIDKFMAAAYKQV